MVKFEKWIPRHLSEENCKHFTEYWASLHIRQLQESVLEKLEGIRNGFFTSMLGRNVFGLVVGLTRNQENKFSQERFCYI